MSRVLMIALLNYSGEVNPAVGQAIDRAVAQCRGLGWPTILLKRVGDSLLVRARNNTLAEFLSSNATDLICLDDDVSWDADELIRLVSHPVDFVAGVYRAKVDDPLYYVRWLPKPELWADDRGLIEVEGVPAGFMKLTRACVERMTIAYPHLQYADDTIPGGRAWLLFDTALQHNRLWGEDYIFCQRWRDIGGRIFIDPELTLHHHGKPDAKTGEKKIFSGCIGRWLQNRKEAA